MSDQDGPKGAAFLELIERHGSILQKIARAYCPAVSQRADLVQEMTIALWRSFDRYDVSRKFSTWMYRIALNVAISYFRRESRWSQRREPLEDEDRSTESDAVDPRVDSLLACIDELAPLDKALVLMYLDGCAHAEIAGALGISVTNTATKIGRIKERLRRAIAVEEGATHGTR